MPIKNPRLHKPQFRPTRDRKDKGACKLLGILPCENPLELTPTQRQRLRHTDNGTEDLPPVGGINFAEIGRVCLPAKQVFTPEELEARLDALAALAAQRKPLFASRRR